MLNRPAPTDTTTTIRTLARPTDITAQIGSITASSLASVPGTVGAMAVAADTGATIGDTAVATVIVVATDIAVGTGTEVATVTTAAMLAAVMDTTVVEDITAAAGPMPAVVDTAVAVVVDTTVAVVVDTTAAAAAADTTVAVVAVASTAAVAGMVVVADIDSP